MTVEEHAPNERLRHARSLRGWSQAKLAEEVGTSFEMVSRWERGVTIPTLYFRAHLCTVLGMTAEELGLVHDSSEQLAIPTSPFVFLACSYADSEKAVITRLKTVFQKRGIPLWSSRHIGRQGLEQPRKALREVVRTAQVILLIVSPEARSSRHIREALEIGRMYMRPVCAIWIEGENWQECLPPDEQELPVAIDARVSDDPGLFEEIVTRLQLGWSIPDTSTASDPGVSQEQGTTSEPRNPYKGLQAFRQEDQHDFFGRDALIEKLTSTLAGTLSTERIGKPSARLLAIIGPSGSGKSSVVMAGLLPRLLQGGIPGSEAWIYLDPIVPSAHPLESLALTLGERLPDRSLHTIRQDLEEDSTRGLHQLATTLTHNQSIRVLLCVDQFEELFTQTSVHEEREQFLELLVTALSEPRGPIIVLLTLRADFYDRPMHYPDLFELIEDHHSFVLPMSLKELREVIEKPAGLPDVQVIFEDDLVSDLLFEVQEQAGALPLLQFTLDQLFQKRNGHQLTIRAYEEIGGVKGAIAKHAETTYNTLPSEEYRKLARGLFLRLIDPGVNAQDTTRRRVMLSELVLSNPKAAVNMEEVTQAFIKARLLTSNTVFGIATVEVSHEAVIREWKRLSNWLEEAREDIILLQMIQEDAAEWKRHEHSVDRLYRGSQLAEALTCRERSLLSLDGEAFLQASAIEQAQQEKILADRQRQEAWQRMRYTRRTVLVGLAGLGLAAGAVTASRWLFSETVSRPSLSPISLPYIYQGHTDGVNDVAWSPDGKRLASASQDKTVRVWDASTGQTLLTYRGHTDFVYEVAWSPDGKRLASASQDKTVRVWDASTGQTLLTYRGHTELVDSVFWSPDGKRLASASLDKTAQVWDASTGQTLLTYRGHTNGVYCVAWSPDGTRLASTSPDKTAQVWDASTGQTLLTYRGHTDFVYEVAWSPDGKRLASASQDKTVRVWDASTGQTLLTCRGHTNAVESVAWSPDGKHLASSSDDRTVRVWDASLGQTLFTYRGHTDAVYDVIWSPDGKRLASASPDKTVRIWDFSSGQTLLTYRGHVYPVDDVAWSPDGKRLASASVDMTVKVWDASLGQTLLTYRGHTDVVTSVAWSPDGKRLASASRDVTVQMWNASSGQILLTYRGHTNIVTSVAWSPDGKRLASASADRTVQVWSANIDSGGTILTYRGHTDVVTSVVWSPDGKRLASASADNTVQVWDASSGQTLLTYKGHSNEVEGVAWSPDGKHLASASGDKTVQVWDASSGQPLLTHRGHTDVVTSVVWSPDGKRLASASWDKTVRVWNGSLGQTLLTFRGHTDVVTSVVWSPDNYHLASSSWDWTVRVWLLL